ncbi:MAG: nucleotide disphospho-sugar-binding domain-containing protein, partial [Bryobacteraceae bacterium]
FLLASWSFETHAGVFLSVAEALLADGHEVAIYTAERERKRVEAIGARLFPFRALNQEEADLTVDRILHNRKRPWRLWRSWRGLLLQTLPQQVQDLQAAIKTYQPDVIVGDTALWSVVLVIRETTGIPAAMLSHVALCLQPGDSGPVHGRAMPPRRTAGQRLAAAVIEALSGYSRRDVLRTSNRLRAEHGLPAVTKRMAELMGEMDLYLVPTCRSFDYSRSDLPASVHYIGPCLWPPGHSLRPARRQEGPPRIIAEEGTLYAESPVLLHATAEGLAGSGMAVTLVAGKGRSLESLNLPTPPGIELVSWRPLHTILDDADVVLTNGNTASVMAALLKGLPLLVVPSLLDQGEIARRVEESGAGILLAEGRCTPRRLRTAVEQLLGEPSFRHNALRLAAELGVLEGPSLAARHLAQLVQKTAFI